VIGGEMAVFSRKSLVVNFANPICNIDLSMLSLVQFSHKVRLSLACWKVQLGFLLVDPQQLDNLLRGKLKITTIITQRVKAG
jgi:hypothetical protein